MQPLERKPQVNWQGLDKKRHFCAISTHPIRRLACANIAHAAPKGMLSIVIVNWNTKALLEKCLASLQQHAPAESFEVIVVDNASEDGSAAMVRSRFPQVRLLTERANHGYAAGNNIGIRAALGDAILLLNPDTEFIDDSLQRSVDILRSMPTVGVLAARLVSPDGSTQSSLRSFPRPLPVLFDL
ncbi:MAG: hypothetical protein C4340_04425, partial [Armatimonadota bacterium]